MLLSLKKSRLTIYFCLGSFWIFILSLYVFFVTSLPFPTEEGEIQFFFSEERDDLKYLICKGLKSAKRSIFLSSFGFTDDEVGEILAQKEEEGLPIKVAFDKKAPNFLPKHHSFDKQPHLRSGLMHRKLIAIDEELLFLGSTNMTPFSLSLHRNFIALIRSKNLFQAIQKESLFEGLNFTYYPMPQKAKEAKHHLLKALHSAKNRIFLAIYTLTHPDFVEALIIAQARGVLVKVYMDQGMLKGMCQPWVQKLQESGIYVAKNRGFELLHHKCCLIDDSFFFGSANWTKSAFGKNEEYLLQIKDLSPKQKSSIEHFFHRLHRSCTKSPLPVEAKICAGSS